MGIQHQLLRNASQAPSKTLIALTPQIPPARIPVYVHSSRCSTALSRSFYRIPLNSTINPPKISTLSAPKPRLVLSHPSRRVGAVMASTGSVQKSEEEWRAILSPEQFRILRMKGTESLPYQKDLNFQKLAALDGQKESDPDGRRTEITCAAYGGHLGHVFKG